MTLRLSIIVGLAACFIGLGSAHGNAQEPVLVQLDTSEGMITLELNAEEAPKTVANFLEYVKNGFYENTVFHRVIDGFMIQGGGFDKEMKKKDTLAPIRNEAGNGLKNDKYTIAMARLPDPHSATSQFFINTADNAPLNRATSGDGFGYTVFGKVIEGKEVVDRIGKTPTRPVRDPSIPGGLMQDVPVNPIVIRKAKVVVKANAGQ
ncbi:Peptidyl-prolyl cis-trans isomerase cyp18 [Novipirellula aureliae]|uniref:Peptidyl-prolyl cis-trans isomerase n=1 Tax=Novipirellula aureliae TaxID=2527966 RepID=A0A5C6EA09_9BACT|nr:peptidylprolyl isomerase [Novipirellula aureliae]TWU45365.1 Peptidyl-prolyl cis-trans isomerase cyp18 [Novipirellula aureliae]